MHYAGIVYERADNIKIPHNLISNVKKIIEGFAILIYLKTDSCTFGYNMIFASSIEHSISPESAILLSSF